MSRVFETFDEDNQSTGQVTLPADVTMPNGNVLYVGDDLTVSKDIEFTLGEIMEGIEEFNDLASERMVGGCELEDISFLPVGVSSESVDEATIVIKVSGNIQNLLEDVLGWEEVDEPVMTP